MGLWELERGPQEEEADYGSGEQGAGDVARVGHQIVGRGQLKERKAAQE